MNLSDLRKANPKAFQAYVDMLVEDCEDEFEIIHGVLSSYTPAPADDPEAGVLVQRWDPDAQDGSWSVVE